MGLRGDLAELRLPDLVEMTAIGGKTGLLVLYDEEDAVAGDLSFRSGRLVGARCGALAGERAFYALLALAAGTFHFDPAATLHADGCDLPTESLLIEGMRRLDEVERLRRSLPAPARLRLLDGKAQDELEARALAYLGPGARRVGDVVDVKVAKVDLQKRQVDFVLASELPSGGRKPRSAHGTFHTGVPTGA